ncbi:hypothetical protein GCM10011390_34220 [Aureimonas endophytica]|uniref:Uncharacterized protein n=2 Tax=Aureimonas endophytica TaxID=2027858 RepID=A0A917E8W5_9HYPH|nr:hypothetical protein GCM10011390_34220 [Aureimonas endophytica]
MAFRERLAAQRAGRDWDRQLAERARAALLRSCRLLQGLSPYPHVFRPGAQLRFFEASPLHFALLARLDDTDAAEDSIGAMLTEDWLPWLEAVAELHQFGLIELHFGWQGQQWLRLTARGRGLLAERAAPDKDVAAAAPPPEAGRSEALPS